MMYLVEISPRKLRGVVSLTAVTFASLGKLSGRLFGLRYEHGDSSFLFSDHFTRYESLISTNAQNIIGKPCSAVALWDASGVKSWNFQF